MEFGAFLKSFEAVNNPQQIREIDFKFYEYSNLLSLQKKNDSSKKQPKRMFKQILQKH